MADPPKDEDAPIKKPEDLEHDELEQRFLTAISSDNYTVAGYYLDAMRHREARSRERRMFWLTVAIVVLTAAVAILTGFVVFRPDPDSGGSGCGRSSDRPCLVVPSRS